MGGASAYYSVLILLAIFGIFSGLAQGTIFMIAAKFPGPEMGMVMFGNGIAGLGANALRAISLSVWQGDKGESNLFYATLFNFSFGVLFFVICTILVALLNKSEYARYYLNENHG